VRVSQYRSNSNCVVFTRLGGAWYWSLAATGRRAEVRGIVAAEPQWPIVNTLAFNAEDPGSTLSIENNFSSRSTSARIRGIQFKLKVTFRVAISNAILLIIYHLYIGA